MANNLVILESPSKALTVKGYLGTNYKVIASIGHVRDLPKSSLGVDVEHDFETHYINIRGKGDLIKEIRKEAKAANKVYLATDPDREGEAIAWHLAAALGIPVEKTQRICFNEVTKTAVKAAIKAPRQIDMNLVNSQQTRRILDRVVGYKLSPLLWKNVKSGLSAGRVQSVATKIIVEREREIKSFVPVEYWTIETLLTSEDNKSFRVHFWGNADGKINLGSEAEAMAVANAVNGKNYTVASVRKATKHKTPAAPFTTSSLQQEAFRKLGFQSQRTMKVAQELYEGVNLGSEFGGTQGLITYMRTDSVRVSADAQAAAREFIVQKYGQSYCPETPRVYKSKAGAQDAHEAIRPARVDLEPLSIRKQLTSDQYKLYKMIWECFIASQMESATLDTISIDFSVADYIFRTSGYSVSFQGYMAVYEESEEASSNNASEPREVKDIRLPEMNVGQELHADDAELTQHFTEPPVRYNDASLIKMLKDLDIGRPSTYATIIGTIIARNYVKREGKAFVPTPLGEVTNQLMEQNFPTIVDYGFTAEMERDLDAIENGEAEMLDVLKSFWGDFSKQLEVAEKAMAEKSIEVPPEETDFICEKCGSRMIVRNGRFGKFAACPNYPTCRNTKPLTAPGTAEEVVEEARTEEEAETKQKTPVVADFKCEKCGGDMVLRTGKFGSFYACARYPECKFTKARVRELGINCPKCSAKVVTKYGRNHTVFYSCERYPDCDFSSWDLPTKELCPECGKMLFRKKGKSMLVCHEKDCGYSREIKEETVAPTAEE
ncbi:MAG: type I DNA topoisomerase [Clostridia bacterium]|nr:type I DNA topoisomerase [Clostridia bacterium]